jgi:hypothetical protein
MNTVLGFSGGFSLTALAMWILNSSTRKAIPADTEIKSTVFISTHSKSGRDQGFEVD